MLTAGRACLILALAIAVYGVAASLYGARTHNRAWVLSGRRAVYALAGVLVVAFGILEAAFLRSDFSFALVGSHSSTTTPLFYRVTAMWSSQEGSLLLWATLLSLWSSLILWLVRHRLREVAPYATAVLLGLAAFFCGMLVFLESPFTQVVPAPAEGTGLNPLLRHPSMMIHPPMLYSGYTLFAVPFAFAIGALITRRTGAEWIRTTRPFTLAAWFFLGVGVVLGARWSYSELGWGGYWAWDPVENASLLPWLTGTAFLHSVMIQEKRGMLKIWNVSLVLATGILAVLGTFLVRSGILDSIHAFGASTLGVPFLVLIALMIAGSIWLVVSRADALRSEHRLDSLLSREAVFLLNNLVLVGMAFVVFWGTFFPLISEAVTGTKASVGPPWFDRYIVPLALVLVLLSGLGPVIAWRRATLVEAAPDPAGAGGLRRARAGGDAAWRAALRPGRRRWLMFVFAAFVIGVVGQEFWRGARARRAMSGEALPVALVSLVRRNRRRYGGYLVHVGVAVLFVGVAASSAFQVARDVPPAAGPDRARRRLRHPLRAPDRRPRVRAQRPAGEDRPRRGARGLQGRRDARPAAHRALLLPDRRPQPRAGRRASSRARRRARSVSTPAGATTSGARSRPTPARSAPASARATASSRARRRPASRPNRPIRCSPRRCAGSPPRYADDPPPATFRLLVSPLVTWIWIGALIVFAGALIALWPPPGGLRRPVAARYKARVARELEPA